LFRCGEIGQWLGRSSQRFERAAPRRFSITNGSHSGSSEPSASAIAPRQPDPLCSRSIMSLASAASWPASTSAKRRPAIIAPKLAVAYNAGRYNICGLGQKLIVMGDAIGSTIEITVENEEWHHQDAATHVASAAPMPSDAAPLHQEIRQPNLTQ
jgi:hypothetical protein